MAATINLQLLSLPECKQLFARKDMVLSKKFFVSSYDKGLPLVVCIGITHGGAGELYVVLPGTEPGLSACKSSILPAIIYHLAPRCFLNATVLIRVYSITKERGEHGKRTQHFHFYKSCFILHPINSQTEDTYNQNVKLYPQSSLTILHSLLCISKPCQDLYQGRLWEGLCSCAGNYSKCQRTQVV